MEVCYVFIPSLHVAGRVPGWSRVLSCYQTGATCVHSSPAISPTQAPHALRCLIILLGGSSSCGEMADAMGASRTRGPFLFLPISHCGTGNTLCCHKDTCNQPLTPPSHFESLSAGLRAGANPRCVYRTTDPTAGCPVCSFIGALLLCGFIWMMCPHLCVCVCFFSTIAGY